MNQEVLEALAEWLRERNLSAKTYSGYVEVERPKAYLTITLEEDQLLVDTNAIKQGCPVWEDFQVDLNDPNSFQAIYEFCYSKKWN